LKVSSQLDTFPLVEAMRTIYGPDLILMFFPDVEMSIDVLEAEEVAFILVTNKKHKRKSKASFLSSMYFSNFRSKILLISYAVPLSKTVTTCSSSAIITNNCQDR